MMQLSLVHLQDFWLQSACKHVLTHLLQSSSQTLRLHTHLQVLPDINILFAPRWL